MQWGLFLLFLMGQCSFFMCHLYEYHFVGEMKTWEDAKMYCRAKHTDLATVSNMTDMKRLCDSARNHDEAWIGLYSDPDRNKKEMWHWQWSLPGLEFDVSESRWHDREPNNAGRKPEKCVRMSDHKWIDVHCSHDHKFICYDGRKQSNKKFHLIDEEMTWQRAQSYCREHHTDLVSGHKQLKELNDIGANDKVWIGLFRDSWRWSDESSFSFRNGGSQFDDESDSQRCAATMLNDGGRWKDEDCNKEKPFFCYDDKVILINESMTWEDALYHCRENYRDLVSITNQNEQRWVQEKAKKANSRYVWLGLRYTCTLDFWFWVNDDVVTYENWDTDVPADDCDMSGAMDRGGDHQWFKKTDNEKFNFICSTC